MTVWLQGPVVAAVAGLVAAGLLVLLHRLMPRPVRREVATTMFWRAAAREQEPRALGGRWARWGSFLMILAVLALLAGGLTRWEWKSRAAGGPVVLVVDTGFTMAGRAEGGGTRIEQAVRQVRSELGGVGGRRVAIVEAGAEPRVVLGFGEPVELGGRVLKDIRVQDRPSARGAALRLARSMVGDEAQGQVVLYSDRQLMAGEAIEKDVTLRVIAGSGGNAAVLSAVFVPGEGARGTLRVRVGMWRGEARGVQMVVGEARREAMLQREGEETATAVFEGLEADGREFVVRVVGGETGVAADDVVRGRLPRGGRPVFYVIGEIPVELRAALAAMGEIVNRPAAGAISVVAGDGDGGPGAGVIRVLGGNGGVAAGTAVSGGETGLPLDLEQGVCGAGADVREAGGKALLHAGEAVVAGKVERDGRRELVLSDALFSAQGTLAGKAGFFEWLRRGCGEVAGATGAPMSVPLERRLADPLWESGSAVEIVGSRETSGSDRPDRTEGASAALAGGGTWGYAAWEIVLALGAVALVVEGWLYRMRRIA